MYSPESSLTNARLVPAKTGAGLTFSNRQYYSQKEHGMSSDTMRGAKFVVKANRRLQWTGCEDSNHVYVSHRSADVGRAGKGGSALQQPYGIWTCSPPR
jgi:hypothetical protein